MNKSNPTYKTIAFKNRALRVSGSPFRAHGAGHGGIIRVRVCVWLPCLGIVRPLHYNIRKHQRHKWLKRKVSGTCKANSPHLKVLSSLCPSSFLVGELQTPNIKYSQRRDKPLCSERKKKKTSWNDKQLLEKKIIFLNSVREKAYVSDFSKQLYFWPLHNPQKVFQLENGWDSPYYWAPCSQTDERGR